MIENPVTIDDVAYFIHYWLIRLIPISVVGLVVLWASELARTHNELLIPIAMILAAIWAYVDLQ